MILRDSRDFKGVLRILEISNDIKGLQTILRDF